MMIFRFLRVATVALTNAVVTAFIEIRSPGAPFMAQRFAIFREAGTTFGLFGAGGCAAAVLKQLL